MIKIPANSRGKTFIGRLGENEHRCIVFPDTAPVVQMYPDAIVTVLHQRPGDPDAYPVSPSYVQIEDGVVGWIIQSGDLARDGFGTCEIVFTQGAVVAKTMYYTTEILPALDGNGNPPEPWEGWVQDVAESADEAKKWAIEEDSHGNPVPPTDTTHYHNSAKYHAEQAEAAAGHYPKIENGTWWVWDVQSGAFVDTHITAQGPAGQDGTDGIDGADGYSPTASVSKSGSTATISITDKNGTTTATVIDGTDGTDGQDGAPGVGVPSGGTIGQVLKKKSGTDYDTEWGNEPSVPVTDVQVNGTSILNNGVANVPLSALNGNPGAVKLVSGNGIGLSGSNNLMVVTAIANAIKAGTNTYTPITPGNQDSSTFYGLAKAAGADMASSSNPVGTYTDAAKSAISTMLNAPISVSGSTPSITALAGLQYICGEVSTLTITLPATGCIDVIFESGSTATVLTITPPAGVTVKWANGFDPTSLEANTTYEINICDGLGVAGSWT